MITTLGQHISIIRPKKIYQNISSSKELFIPKYNKQAKENNKNSGRVISACIELYNGQIKSLKVPTTHLAVCEYFNIQNHEILKTGWLLENNTYLWR